MRLTSLFARRYLSSRKSLSVINIISRVSIFAVGVPVAAMVILLSVFNGFEGLVRGMYTAFDPDILVTPVKGKVFDAAQLNSALTGDIEGIEQVSYYLEESVLLEYRGRQTIATLRGVDENYNKVVPIESLMARGDYVLRFGDMEQAVAGMGIAYDLGIHPALFDPLNVYAPRRGSFSSLLPIDAYSTGRLFPEGMFTLDAETDGKYVLSTIEFARTLFDYEGKASAVAIKTSAGVSADDVREEIAHALGGDYRAETRYEQKAAMFRIMKYEKWGIFFITLLVLVIASFSIVGSLVMLIIDKRPDIRTLMTMGGDTAFVRRIFVDEGMLIGVLGTAGGGLFGILLCILQQQFGLIKLGGASFLVEDYPVSVQWQDIVVVVAATLAVNWIITKFTVSKMIPKALIRL